MLLCDCVWVCVYVGGVVDVVECGLFFESRCVWVDSLVGMVVCWLSRCLCQCVVL